MRSCSGRGSYLENNHIEVSDDSRDNCERVMMFRRRNYLESHCDARDRLRGEGGKRECPQLWRTHKTVQGATE